MRRLVAGLVIVVFVLTTAGVAGAADRAEVRRPGPLRVLLVGDSITVNYQEAVAALLEPKGYEVIRHGIPGTGLLDANICRGQYALSLLKYVDPDVVVYENNGNYGLYAPCQEYIEYGSVSFYRRWRKVASVTQRHLTRWGARFLWVEAPSVNFDPKREAVPRLNAIYRSIGVTVDAWSSFGEATWDQSLRYDVQHLNAAGAQRVAGLVVQAVG